MRHKSHTPSHGVATEVEAEVEAEKINYFHDFLRKCVGCLTAGFQEKHPLISASVVLQCRKPGRRVTQPPCKACLEGAPQHRRQRVIVRKGVRIQVCELCRKTVAILGKLQAKTQEPQQRRKAS